MSLFGKKKKKDIVKEDVAKEETKTAKLSDASTHNGLDDIAAGLAPTANEAPVNPLHFSDKETPERAEQTTDMQSKYASIRKDTEEIVLEEHPENVPDKPKAQRDYEEQHPRDTKK